jgi:tripeptide aminopeptidase
VTDDGAAATPRERLRRHLVTITETAAPTFAEGERADVVATAWRDAGLAVTVDEVGNVVADVPGGEGPRVVLAAHLDTVFAREVDVRVRREAPDRWAAPGVGDNSASLAVLTVLAEELGAGRLQRWPRLTLAATVGEEGLGDLRGAKALVASRRDAMDLFVAVDGHLGTVVHEGVGSRRFEMAFRGPGGHSWGDHGTPSAIHAAADAVSTVTRMVVPREPRSSLNVGLISGGSAVNAIAAEASFTIDIRSVDEATLSRIADEVVERTRSVARRCGVALEVRPVGSRPAASGGNEALVVAAGAALRAVGLDATLSVSSTDANAAMAAGVPAVCFGVYRGGDAHRVSEWIDPGSLELGLRGLQALLRELVAV